MIRGVTLASLVLIPAAAWTASDWTAPAQAKTWKNPVGRTAGIQAGRSLFEAHCAICHGPGGRGDGPAGAALRPKPSDLTGKGVQGQTDGELYWKISQGHGAMPAWKDLPEQDRWSLVRFLHSLNEKK